MLGPSPPRAVKTARTSRNPIRVLGARSDLQPPEPLRDKFRRGTRGVNAQTNYGVRGVPNKGEITRTSLAPATRQR